MQDNLPYTEFQAELSDSIFEELFDFDDSYTNVSETDSIYYDSNGGESLEIISQEILDNILDKDEVEAYQYVAEAWPALIPIVKMLAPIAIQAATQLAPMAIKAAGNFVGKFNKPKSVSAPQKRTVPIQQPHLQHVPIKTIPNPIVNRAPCNCSCCLEHRNQNVSPIPPQSQIATGFGGTLGKIGQGALGTLASLMSNQNVQSIISGLATKGISKAIKLGSSDTTAREGALLNAIEYLAGQALLETSDDQFPDALDYLIGPDGEFATDPHDAEGRALRFIELYTS